MRRAAEAVLSVVNAVNPLVGISLLPVLRDHICLDAGEDVVTIFIHGIPHNVAYAVIGCRYDAQCRPCGEHLRLLGHLLSVIAQQVAVCNNIIILIRIDRSEHQKAVLCCNAVAAALRLGIHSFKQLFRFEIHRTLRLCPVKEDLLKPHFSG